MLHDLLKTLTSIYGDAATLLDERIAHLVVDGQEVLSQQTVPGVTLSVRAHWSLLALLDVAPIRSLAGAAGLDQGQVRTRTSASRPPFLGYDQASHERPISGKKT